MCFIFNCFWRGEGGGGLLLGLSPCRSLCPRQGVWLGSARAPSLPDASQPSCWRGRWGVGNGVLGRPECRTQQHTGMAVLESASAQRGQAGDALAGIAALQWSGQEGCAQLHCRPPNTQTWECEGCKQFHLPSSRAGTCSFSFRGPCTSLTPGSGVFGFRLWLFVLFCLNTAMASQCRNLSGTSCLGGRDTGTTCACGAAFLYVLQPGVETAASPTLHPAVQLLPANISQVQITNHSKP